VAGPDDDADIDALPPEDADLADRAAISDADLDDAADYWRREAPERGRGFIDAGDSDGE
jgi:hypothetical protein